MVLTCNAPWVLSATDPDVLQPAGSALGRDDASVLPPDNYVILDLGKCIHYQHVGAKFFQKRIQSR